jgi:DNA-binding Lrp family transcriptional regulator
MDANAELDAVDLRILAGLQEDGRRSVKALAAGAGVAQSTCAERLRGLVARGIVTGFRAEVDLALLGRGEEAIIGVRVRPHSRELADALTADVLAMPEVVRIMHVAGPDDFLVHVAVADTTALRDFVLDQLTARREVASVQTYLIFDQQERRAQAPLGA